MFPTPAANAYATEYLLEKAAGWGYTGVRESYTSANPVAAQSGDTWQNVVFTLPGQVDFGQHQQVHLRHALRLALVLDRGELRTTRPAPTTRSREARR